jgi:hypothetical protein
VCADIATKGKHAGKIDLQDGLPIVVGKLVSWMSLLDATAVEEDVNSVSVLENFRNQGGDGLVRGEVTCVDLDFSSQPLYCFFRGLAGGVTLRAISFGSSDFVVVDLGAYLNEQNVGSCFGECERHCLSNSSRSTRHEGCMALQRKELLHCRHLSLVWIIFKLSNRV